MFNVFNARLIHPPPPPPPTTDSNISIHFFLRYQFLYDIYKSYQLFCYVAYYSTTLNFCIRPEISEWSKYYLPGTNVHL